MIRAVIDGQRAYCGCKTIAENYEFPRENHGCAKGRLATRLRKPTYSLYLIGAYGMILINKAVCRKGR